MPDTTNRTPPMAELVGLREAVTLAPVSRSTLLRMIRAGELPAWRVGKRTLQVRRADIAGLVTPVTPAP